MKPQVINGFDGKCSRQPYKKNNNNTSQKPSTAETLIQTAGTFQRKNDRDPRSKNLLCGPFTLFFQTTEGKKRKAIETYFVNKCYSSVHTHTHPSRLPQKIIQKTKTKAQGERY